MEGWLLVAVRRKSTDSLKIQSVSRSDGGSAPRDDLYSPERQRRPGHLDEPQRLIPSEDLVTQTAIGTRPQEPDKSFAQSGSALA